MPCSYFYAQPSACASYSIARATCPVACGTCSLSPPGPSGLMVLEGAVTSHHHPVAGVLAVQPYSPISLAPPSPPPRPPSTELGRALPGSQHDGRQLAHSTTIVGSGSIVGSVTSASLLDYVRATRPCASPRAPRRGSLRSHAPQACSPTCPVLIHSGARSLARSHVLSTQANFVAVSGSYAYVTGMYSRSLVVVDISNPASPVIRGSAVSSSLLDHVRVTQSRGARMASGAALASATRASYSHPRRHSLHLLSRTYSFTLTCCAHSLITSP